MNSVTSPLSMLTQYSNSSVETIVSLEYPSRMTHPPVFDIVSHSLMGRPLVWVTDPAGTASLRAGQLPSLLPTIHLNITSIYSTSQALIPPTYHGSLDLSSQSATVSKVDHAKDLPGRSIRWYSVSNSVQQGVVQWDGRQDREQDRGSVRVATQDAAGKILFLGLDDDEVDHWPSE